MSERDAVQNPMLRYADEIGWESISASQALQMRGGKTRLYFAGLLESQLLKLNGEVLDEDRCKEIPRQLNLLNPTREGNREALSWLRGERSIFVPNQERERNVTLIDFDTPDSNLFHVTDEWWQRNAVYRNRADVVFLINGIPVAVVETKNAHKPGRVGNGRRTDSPLPPGNARDVYLRRNCSASHNCWIFSTASPGTPAARICSTGKPTTPLATRIRSRRSSIPPDS